MSERTIIIAENLRQAQQHARENGLRNGAWLYPLTADDLDGLTANHVVYLGQWDKRGNAKELKRAADAAVYRSRRG